MTKKLSIIIDTYDQEKSGNFIWVSLKAFVHRRGRGERGDDGKRGIQYDNGKHHWRCYEVHRAIGPGLLESTYEAWLAFEPLSRGEQR